MRKTTIWLIILCMLFQMAAVHAEGEDLPTNFGTDKNITMVKTDFEDYRGYYTSQRQISPPYWGGWGSNGARFYADELDKAHGKSLCMETSGLLQNPATNTTDAIIFDYTGDFVFELEFYSDTNDAVRTVMLQGNNGYYNVARWKADGSFLLDCIGGYDVIAHPEVGKWHSYKIIYNSENDSCDVYLNNKKIRENVKINAEMKNGVKGVKIKQEGIENRTCKVHYDNLALYAGNNVQEFSALAPMKTVDNLLDTEMFAEEIGDALVLKIDSPFAYSEGKRVQIYEGNERQTTRLVDGKTYVPVRFVVENLGAEAKYNAEDGTVGVGKTKSYCCHSDENAQRMYIYNVYSTTSDKEESKMYIFDDRAYVPLRSLAEDFGKTVTYIEKDRLIFIDDFERNIDTTTTKYRHLVSRLTYDYSEPSASEIKSKFTENVHPRIMVNAEQFEYLKTNKETDELLNTIYTRIKAIADECLDDEYPVYEPALTNAESCLGIIRTAQSNIMMCAAMYKLDGDEKYKERTYNEAKNLCSWIDWNYVHFLDTAEVATAVAIAYDWLYHDWTDEERAVMVNGIKKYALEEAMRSFDGSGWSDWIRLNNNWSFVCNGGISMAAMALFDLYPDMCAEIISNNFKSLAHALPYMAPEGAWEEGISYWQYLMRFYVPMLASLNLTFNTEFGYMDMVEGASETAYFAPYMTGPTGEFNYHDGSGGFSDTAFHFWLAKRLNDKELGGYRMNNILQVTTPSAYDLIWYNADYCNLEANMPLDRLYTDNVTTATFRSSWSDRGALFAGIQGGANNVKHGHVDIGEFVIDALGESFFFDLGSDEYGKIDDDGVAYLGSVNFYRRRAEGHNTIVVNPPGEKVDTFWYDQKKDATGIVRDYVSKPRGGYLKLDMTQSSDDIQTATRGIMMADGRNNVILQDEVTLKDNSDLWWFAHTKADITISEDGREAIAVRNGKYMRVTIQSDDESLKFGVMDAIPLEGSPNPPTQNKNSGIRKLYIHKENAREFNAAVVFTPLSFKDEPFNLPEYKALSEWNIPDGELDTTFNAELTDIKIDDETLEEFYSLQKVYTVNIGADGTAVPEVSAEYTGDATLEILQAEDITECAVVALTDNTSEKTVYYSVGFSMTGREGLPEGLSEYKIAGVEASDEPQSENPKEATLDGKLDTRWSAEGKQTITYDLGTVKDIAAISTAWHNSNVRISYFMVEVSEDNETWHTVFSGNSLEEYSGYNTMLTDGVKARYIRILGQGNSVNSWNSLAEVKIFGDK